MSSGYMMEITVTAKPFLIDGMFSIRMINHAMDKRNVTPRNKVKFYKVPQQLMAFVRIELLQL